MFIRDWCRIFLNPITLYKRDILVDGLLSHMLDCHELVEVIEAPGKFDLRYSSHYFITLLFDDGTLLNLWHVNRFYSWLGSGSIVGSSFNYEWDSVKVSRRLKWRIYKAIMKRYELDGRPQELVPC